MANIKSAQKRAQVSERNRVRNVAFKSTIRTAIKRVVTLASEKAALAEITASVNAVYSVIDRAVLKGVLHKNTAARYKARVAKMATTAAA